MRTQIRAKSQELVNRLQSGKFHQTDVDTILIYLREYSGSFSVIREFAHFVAHSDKRTHGEFYDSVRSFMLNIRYISEYSLKKIPLNLREPIPAYVFRHLEFQLHKVDWSHIKKTIGCSKKEFKQFLKDDFSIDENKIFARLNKTVISSKLQKTLQYCLSFLISRPLFTESRLVSEFLGVLRLNKISFSQPAMMLQMPKIIICMMLLAHNIELFDGYVPIGRCHFSHHCFTGGAENVATDVISVDGIVSANISGNNVQVTYSIFTSTLKLLEWMNEHDISLVVGNGFPLGYWDGDFVLDENFKLKNVNFSNGALLGKK